jgi:hypothetical protein
MISIIGSIVLAAAGGAASAFGGWLFHRIMKLRNEAEALEARVEVLEEVHQVRRGRK